MYKKNCSTAEQGYSKLDCTSHTVFMLIEHMIQLPQENSIPGIICIIFEQKPLPAIIFYESNQRNSVTVRLYCTCSNHVPHVNYAFCQILNSSGRFDFALSLRTCCFTKLRVSFVVHDQGLLNLHSGLTLAGTALSPTARASGLRSRFSGITDRGCQRAFPKLPS